MARPQSRRLPTELMSMIVKVLEADRDRETLCDLSRTCKTLYHLVEPVLYRSVRFEDVPSYSSPLLDWRLQSFYETIASNKHLAQHVKALYIDLIRDTMAGKEDCLARILDHLNLDIFVLDTLDFDGKSLDKVFASLFSGQFRTSLKRFGWCHEIDFFNHPKLIKFLEAQERLEDLRLTCLNEPLCLSPMALPHLRTLETTLHYAIDILRGRNITHLHIGSLGTRDVDEVTRVAELIVEELGKIQLSLLYGFSKGIVRLASYMTGIESLELRLSRDVDIDDFIEEVVTMELNSLRHLRIVLFDSIRRSENARKCFECFPALSILEISLPDGTYERWGRGKEESQVVKYLSRWFD